MGELPVFTCQAHVFTINPKTKKSWIPSSSKAVDINFFFDSNKHCYRIVSIEDGPPAKKIVINSTLTEKMTFKKTSQKFGQWADSKTGAVHGLGFNSEAELTEFLGHFKQYVEASKGSPVTSTGSTARLPDPVSPTSVGIGSCTPSNVSSLNTSLGSPSGEIPPGFMNSITHSTLIAPPLLVMPSASGPIVTASSDNVSHHTYLLQTPVRQQQLEQAQTHIRRLEDELNVTKRQAATVGGASLFSSEGAPSIGPFTRTAGYPIATNESSLLDCMSRLELNGTVINGAGEDCSTDVSQAFMHSSVTKLNGQIRHHCSPGRIPWSDPSNEGTETVRFLHARLGHILQEAIELHNKLGALLPHEIPGGPPE